MRGLALMLAGLACACAPQIANRVAITSPALTADVPPPGAERETESDRLRDDANAELAAIDPDIAPIPRPGRMEYCQGPAKMIAKWAGSGSTTLAPITVPCAWTANIWTDGVLTVTRDDIEGRSDGVIIERDAPGSGSSFQPRGGDMILGTMAVGHWRIEIDTVPVP
jgi:hypothetical protein